MKIRLRCKIFGHDFRMFNDTDEDFISYRTIIPSEHCRNCGLSKEELLKIGDKRK